MRFGMRIRSLTWRSDDGSQECIEAERMASLMRYCFRLCFRRKNLLKHFKSFSQKCVFEIYKKFYKCKQMPHKCLPYKRA